MLGKHERQKQELLIFGIACALCATFLALMLIASWADLLVVSASNYQRQGIELSRCQSANQHIENELRKDLREDWGDIGAKD